MDQKTKEKFINLAADPLYKKDGYVYVGKGDHYPNYLCHQLKCREIFLRFKDGDICERQIGGFPEEDYYLEKSEWEKIFGPLPNVQKESIESRVNFALTFVGKKILSSLGTGNSGTVKGVSVFPDFESYKKQFNPSFKSRQRAEKHFNTHGNIVCFCGRWETGFDMFSVVDSANPPVLYVEPIKVNGHEAINAGSCYQFGCVTIDKNVLVAAKVFLQDQAQWVKNEGNRKIESIKIGAGDFTLDILNKLVPNV